MEGKVVFEKHTIHYYDLKCLGASYERLTYLTAVSVAVILF